MCMNACLQAILMSTTGEMFEEVAQEQGKFFVEKFEAPVPVVEATEAMPSAVEHSGRGCA